MKVNIKKYLQLSDNNKCLEIYLQVPKILQLQFVSILTIIQYLVRLNSMFSFRAE